MADWHKKGVSGVAANVDSGSGSKKGSSGHATLKGTGSVDRHEKTHDVTFAKGGSTPMFGEQQANPDKSGQTGKEDVNGKGAQYAEGGKTPMYGFTGSLPARSGITSAR